MVTAMQAVHCVSWEPLSGQVMRLVWRPQSMHNHKKEITSLFRKSLCVRMRISSLVRTRDSTRSRVGLKSANFGAYRRTRRAIGVGQDEGETGVWASLVRESRQRASDPAEANGASTT